MTDSNPKPTRVKPDKPRKDYPMFAHPSGQWARKIRGKLWYFGVWADPAAAEERHDREYPFLKRGEIPPPIEVGDGVTVKQLCNVFLEAKEAAIRTGEFSQLSWNGYQASLKRLIAHFGATTKVNSLGPAHWAEYRASLAKTLAPTSLKTEIAKVRAVFNWGWKTKLCGQPDYGTSFDRPPQKSLRKHQREGGSRLFTREEIHAILKHSDRQLRAMVLLGLNCGYGNSDIGSLEIGDLDLKSGWATMARVKTEVSRRCPLWPETIAALKEWIPRRPRKTEPGCSRRVFLTQRGTPFVRLKGKTFEDVLGHRFRNLLKRLKINGRRGLGYYALRHVHATIGGNAKDPQAVAATMGHIDGSMTGNYQHGIPDDRLRAVTDSIRTWLFDVPAPGEKEEGGER